MHGPFPEARGMGANHPEPTLVAAFLLNTCRNSGSGGVVWVFQCPTCVHVHGDVCVLYICVCALVHVCGGLPW